MTNRQIALSMLITRLRNMIPDHGEMQEHSPDRTLSQKRRQQIATLFVEITENVREPLVMELSADGIDCS